MYFHWFIKELYFELFSENYLSVIKILQSFPPEEINGLGDVVDY